MGGPVSEPLRHFAVRLLAEKLICCRESGCTAQFGNFALEGKI